VTVALNVTAWPNTEGFGETASVVAVDNLTKDVSMAVLLAEF
jgi:hypothetical protein